MKYIPRTLHIVRSGVVHLILGGACCFTAFPFLWMAVSSLKTKEEVMAVDTFLPSDSQYQNYTANINIIYLILIICYSL